MAKGKEMEFIEIPGLKKKASRIGLGTWAIGGWMWGGTEERTSIDTILEGINKGMNLIDTAPVYGFGTSERIVGKAIEEYGQRDDLIITTKVGLEWNDQQKVKRNSSRDRILKEVDDSIDRLGVDHIDVYMIHWPDHQNSFEETASTMKELHDSGRIGAIAVSNFSPDQMDRFREHAPIHVAEPPYNLFEREIESDVLPYCLENNIATFTYGAICRGLLSGKMKSGTTFEGDDLRKVDPKFKGNLYEQYLEAVGSLDELARKKFKKRVLHLAVRWVLDQKASVALWGARRPDQLSDVPQIMDFELDEETLRMIDKVIEEKVMDPVGPEFMAPPE